MCQSLATRIYKRFVRGGNYNNKLNTSKTIPPSQSVTVGKLCATETAMKNKENSKLNTINNKDASAMPVI
jgi:hypothetical protein